VTVLKPPHRFRRAAVLATVALVFGVAAHTACQAIEHHDGLKDVVALCAAAVALVAGALIGGGGRRRQLVHVPRWVAVPLVLPGHAVESFGSSPALLQRFRN
jgi:hypothetical protein